MAILIFTKDSDNKENCLYRMAASQAIYDANKNWNEGEYELVTISDDEYNNIKNGTKEVVKRNGDTIQYLDHTVKFHKYLELRNEISSKIDVAKKWLLAGMNASKPMASDVSTYINWLEGLDVTSLITEPSDSATWDQETVSWSDGTPLTISIEAHGIAQGVNVFHPLELL